MTRQAPPDPPAPPGEERDVPRPAGSRGVTRSHRAVLGLVMAVYLATRLWRIEHFPMGFLCDEAIQPVLARELIHHGLRGSDGVFLPTYFKNYSKWSLGLSVYIHAVTVSLFGTSVLVTRATSVAVGALAPLAAAVTLRSVFRSDLWWTAPLVMGMLPAWFLHSRMAYETVMATGFWAVFLLAWLLYRTRSPRWLPLVVLAGGATFATYTNGQGLVGFCVLVLGLGDLKYHLRAWRTHRRWVAGSAILVLLLAAPYFRFHLLDHPEASRQMLRDVGSYWIEPIPVREKLERHGRLYLRGLSPAYWFRDDPETLPRHRIPGTGFLPLWIAPFLALGLGAALWRWRSPPHRTLLVALLAVPFAPAVAGIEIPRVLAMVVPVTLLAVLGADLLWNGIRHRIPAGAPRLLLGLAAGLLLAGGNGILAHRYLSEGPSWYSGPDWEMYGLQWGAQEVFGAIAEELDSRRGVIHLSHGWTNNPEALARFFLEPRQLERLRLFGPGDHLREMIPFESDTLYVVTREESEALCRDPRIACSAPARIVRRPDGEPGFLFLELAYAPEAAEIFAAEEAERRRPRRTAVRVDGEPWVVTYPALDLGNPRDPFDSDPDTVARTDRVDPAVWTVELPHPRPVAGVRLGLFARDYEIRLEVTGEGGRPVTTTARFHDLPTPPVVTVALPAPVARAVRVRVEIDRLDWDHHVHLRELELLAPTEPGAGPLR